MAFLYEHCGINSIQCTRNPLKRAKLLRWRFYECSGDVPYDPGSDAEGNHEVGPSDPDLRESQKGMTKPRERVSQFQEKLAQFFTILHEFEHGVFSHSAVLHRVVGTSNESDRLSASIFCVLRQKTALTMQELIPGNSSRVKQARGSDANCSHYDVCTVAFSRTDAECPLQNFESISRVVPENPPREIFTSA